MSVAGDAFVASFNRTREINAAKKQDAFRVAFDEYVRKKEEYDSAYSEDQALITKAKSIVSRLPGTPPEAWVNAYELLRDGYDAADVERKIRTTRWATADSAPQNVPEDQQPVNMDTQMQQSGLIPAANTEQHTTQTALGQPIDLMQPNQQQVTGQMGQNGGAKPPGLLDQVMGGIEDFRNSRRQANIDQANRQVMAAGGIDQAQFDKVMGGYTPGQDMPQGLETLDDPMAFWFPNGIDKNAITEADVRASFYKQNGTPEEQRRAQEYFEQIQPTILSSLAEESGMSFEPTEASVALGRIRPLKETATNAQMNFATTVDKVNDIAEIVQRNPDVLSVSLGVLVGGRTLLKEASILTERIFGTDTELSLSEALQRSRGTLPDLLNGIVDQSDVEDYQNFESALISMVYAQLRADGMSGNTISNMDFQNKFRELQSGANDGAFFSNLKRMVGDAYGIANRTVSNYDQDGEVNFLRQNGLAEFVDTGAAAMTVDEYLASQGDGGLILGMPVKQWINSPAQQEPPTGPNAASTANTGNVNMDASQVNTDQLTINGGNGPPPGSIRKVVTEDLAAQSGGKLRAGEIIEISPDGEVYKNGQIVE